MYRITVCLMDTIFLVTLSPQRLLSEIRKEQEEYIQFAKEVNATQLERYNFLRNDIKRYTQQWMQVRARGRPLSRSTAGGAVSLPDRSLQFILLVTGLHGVVSTEIMYLQRSLQVAIYRFA